MLIHVSLLLLSAGVYASHAYRTTASPVSTTEDELFDQLADVFPGSFVSKFPQESEFFRVKIFGYLIFHMFAKHFGETEPSEYWSRLNQNDFNRVAVDAVFYEYFTKFADKKIKHLLYDPLKGSTSIPENIAINRIGNYLDKLSEAEDSDQSETPLQDTKTKYHKHRNTKMSVETPIYGIAGKDFPNYYDIPETSFTCANKLVPGIYADVETGCQVFHTCLPRRIDSFLCPIGTTFNQALLTCDFWNESDCSSASLLFDQPPFAMGKTPESPEPTVATDENQATSETSTVLQPEWAIPLYDGTCESLFCEPLQMNMKFPPVKCKFTDLKQGKPGGLSKDDIVQFDKLMAEMVSGNMREMFDFIVKASEIESRRLEATLRELKREKQTQKLDSKVAEETTECPPKEAADTTAEQIYSSTTELPLDKSPPRIDSRFVVESVVKSTLPGKMAYSRSVRKSSLLKPSKPFEPTIRHVFDTMRTSLELGGRIINDGLLPLVEQIVLDSHRKKSAKS